MPRPILPTISPIQKKNFDLFLILPAVILLGLFILSFPTVMTSDGTRYLLGAKFIHAGMGYMTYGFESVEIVPQIGWPPLFSFLIAAVMKITGVGDIYAMRAVNFLSLLMYYLSFYGLITVLFEEKKFQRAAHGLVLISSIVWSQLNVALSEPLFMAWFGLSLVLVLKAATAEAGKNNFLFFSAGIVTALLCLTKYSGIFIAAGYALFFLLTIRSSASRKSLALLFFSIPIASSVGSWFLRNKLLSGYSSFIDVFQNRSFFEDFLQVEASFIRTLVESIMGFSTYRWTEPFLTFLPTLGFLIGAAIVAGAVWTKREELFRDPKSAVFFQLASIVVLIYILAFNFIRLQKGFGENLRYFQVLCPIVFLAALTLLRPLGRSLAGGLLIAFLLLSSFFHGVRVLKEIYGFMRSHAGAVAGVSSPSFAASGWVFGLFGQEIKREDVVISNDPTFLMYAADRPCRITVTRYLDAVGFKGQDKPRIALEEVRGTSRNVYVILDKKLPCVDPFIADCENYLRTLRFEKIREDEFSIAVKLIK